MGRKGEGQGGKEGRRVRSWVGKEEEGCGEEGGREGEGRREGGRLELFKWWSYTGMRERERER